MYGGRGREARGARADPCCSPASGAVVLSPLRSELRVEDRAKSKTSPGNRATPLRFSPIGALVS